MSSQVTLYIATHKDGYKYFGKTELYFTQEDLQKYYHGSGKGWKEHLEEFGDNVTMEIYGIYKKSEVKEIALKFSRDNNIVESDLWANRKEETGSEGGRLSSETKDKISESNRGKPKSEAHKNSMRNCNRKPRRFLTKEHSQKISEANKGKPSKLKGTKLSEETKQKLRKPKTKSRTDEHRKSLSKAGKGLKWHYNPDSLETTRCYEENCPDGWLKGRPKLK